MNNNNEVISKLTDHNGDKNLLRFGERIKIGDDKIYISSEDIVFLKPLPYVKVINDNSVSIELLKKEI